MPPDAFLLRLGIEVPGRGSARPREGEAEHAQRLPQRPRSPAPGEHERCRCIERVECSWRVQIVVHGRLEGRSQVGVLTVISRPPADFPETREALQAIEEELRLELLVAPYDPYSAYTLRVAAAFAVEARRVRLEVIEISEFPRLAQTRMVTEVPVLLVNGRRFTGAWDENDLLEQLKRVAAGDSEPVIRERILVSPFMDVDQAQAFAAREAQGGARQPPTTPGGLIIPGR